jgi:hypothetical protein
MRWFFRTHERRLWLIAGYGAGVIVATSSIRQPIVGDLIEDLVFFVGIVLALAGLSGVGPLAEKPTPIDQLDQLARQWRAGEVTDDQFEAQKRRILNL